MDETPYDADRADHGSAALDRWLDDGDGAIHPVQLVDLGTISSPFSPGLILSTWALFHGHGFCQVAWLIGIGALGLSRMICEQLRRDGVDDGG